MFEAGEKIFVAVAVISLIILGLAAFLFYLEHRIGRSEKKLRELEERLESGESGEREIEPGALKS